MKRLRPPANDDLRDWQQERPQAGPNLREDRRTAFVADPPDESDPLGPLARLIPELLQQYHGLAACAARRSPALPPLAQRRQVQKRREVDHHGR